MRLKMLREFVYVVIALGVFYLVVPFLPTSILIQMKELKVTSEQDVYLTRTVTAPTDGFFTSEVMQGDHLLIECNRSGRTFFEQRGEIPVDYTLSCAPLDEGEYEMTLCISAVGPMGIRLRPSCLTTDFTVGPSVEMRQDDLQEQIQMLEDLVQELQGDRS